MPLTPAKDTVQNLGTECKVEDADSALVLRRRPARRSCSLPAYQLAKRRAERIPSGVTDPLDRSCSTRQRPTWQRLRAAESEAADRVDPLSAPQRIGHAVSQLRLRAAHVNHLQGDIIDQKSGMTWRTAILSAIWISDNLLLELRTLQSDPCAKCPPARSPAFDSSLRD